MTDKYRVHFALKLMMEIRDPDAVAALRFAANQLACVANILIREQYERECG